MILTVNRITNWICVWSDGVVGEGEVGGTLALPQRMLLPTENITKEPMPLPMLPSPRKLDST